MKAAYRFQVYMEDMSHFSNFSDLVADYFTCATIRHGCQGMFLGETERSSVLEYITDSAVEGEGTCQRFSDAYCKLYDQACTMITMDRIHRRMSNTQ